MKILFKIAAVLFILTIGMDGRYVFAQRGTFEIIEGDKLHNVLPKDRIQSIDEPEFVTVDEADEFMDGEELVLGVIVGGDVRAYSTWQLENHEIVNDVVGGVPLAVTW